MNRLFTVVTVVIALTTVSQVNADIEFYDGFDGQYNPSVWTMTLLTSGVGGTVSNTLITSGGGNTGNWRRTDDTINGSSEAKAAIGSFKNSAAMYDPSTQGAIASIYYSEDQKMVSSTLPDGTSGQRASIAIFQGGNIYYSFGVTGRSTSWHEQLKDPMTSGNFVQINNPSIPGGFLDNSSSHPDFTSTGGPIYFGYYRGNSDGADGVGGYTQSMGIDNWHVIIRTTPEPTTMVLVSAGLALATRLRRRRQDQAKAIA